MGMSEPYPEPRRGHPRQPADECTPAFTRDGIRAMDAAARTDYGLPSLVLMENAARGLAGVVLDWMPRDDTGHRDDHERLDSGVLIVCGTGHNGGDGLAAARHLHNAGVDVACLLVCDAARCAPDTRVHFEIAERMGIPLTVCATPEQMHATPGRRSVVDALFGVGLDRPATGVHGAAIEAMVLWRHAGAVLVAADLPSGLDADTGLVYCPCAGADVTATMAGPKAGFANKAAKRLLGTVIIVDIGVPRALLMRFAATPEPGD